ncbi:MAG: YraN family protein [Slackia sp.]|uniref:YraN family protein n=1 Tax=uncultured Slackia sp. TaxID=665903 RepID=UPI002803C357|nr:YraN family protein [uncultured Slackia sp.]MDU6011475.1 YraN family protein [Slackia sp.]
MKDNNLIDRAVSASARYCELKGYEVLEQNWSPEGSEESIPLIAYEDDTLVFIDVKARNGLDGFIPESETDREAMEILAAKYLAQTDLESNVEVRFDIISMMVVGESRAMLKHHINAFSEAA